MIDTPCSACGKESTKWKKLYYEEGIWYCPDCWPKVAAENRCCEWCGGRLVAIGHARANGKNHKDWEKRTLHKRCWMILHG